MFETQFSMDCPQVQDWLLRTEAVDPERCASPEHAEHLRSCSVCRGLITELAALEQNWRDIPLPASAATAKSAFLSNLASQERRRGRAHTPSRRVWFRSAVAASLLLAASIGGLLVLDKSRANAAPSVVEELIDWNLELAESSPNRRTTIYGDRVEQLRTELANAELPGEDRAFGEQLLTNASWLSQNDDPMSVADRFTAVADSLLDKIDAARSSGNVKELRRLTRLYARVSERGIESKLEIVLASKGLDFEHMRRLEKMILKDDQRRQKLQTLLERSPEASRKEIKRALGLPRKPNKQKDATPPSQR